MPVRRVCLVTAIALATCASLPTKGDGSPVHYEPSATIVHGDVSRTTIHYIANGGRRRMAYLLLPSWYGRDNHPRIPLVIAPHGRGAGPFFGQARLWGQLPARGRFAVVIPEGQGRRLAHHSWGYSGQIDDLARMPEILRRTLPWVKLDEARVYAVGASMGGQEALLLAARHPRVLSGAVVFDAPVDMAQRYEQFSDLVNGEALRSLMRAEIGGEPGEAPAAYAERSPLHYAGAIAASGVPLQIWWSTRDELVANQELQSGLLCSRIERLKSRARVQKVVGTWAHVAQFRWDRGLPAALRFLGLLRT